MDQYAKAFVPGAPEMKSLKKSWFLSFLWILELLLEMVFIVTFEHGSIYS